jgi:hypothetical protein
VYYCICRTMYGKICKAGFIVLLIQRNPILSCFLTLHDPINNSKRKQSYEKKAFLLGDQSEDFIFPQMCIFNQSEKSFSSHDLQPIRRRATFLMANQEILFMSRDVHCTAKGRKVSLFRELGLIAVQCTTNRTGPFTI